MVLLQLKNDGLDDSIVNGNNHPIRNATAGIRSGVNHVRVNIGPRGPGKRDFFKFIVRFMRRRGFV